jgi:hypothetical protein
VITVHAEVVVHDVMRPMAQQITAIKALLLRKGVLADDELTGFLRTLKAASAEDDALLQAARRVAPKLLGLETDTKGKRRARRRRND